MKRVAILALVALQILACHLAWAQAGTAKEQRLALVIGNGAYKDTPLLNPVNDARDIAGSLEEIGFKVVRLENANQAQMVKALREFGDQLQNGGVGLFYFAGHGMQVRGRNFLIPVGAQIEREDEVAYQSIDANQVLEKMESAHNRLNVVILDACRNNPFARSFRSGAQGLAQMDAPVGTLVAFATAPGSVASDGNSRNGLYTQHLVKNLKVSGLKVEDLFKRVRLAVRQESKGKQIPWESTSLEGDFYFRQPVSTPSKAQPTTRVAFARASAQAPRRAERPAYSVGDEWSYLSTDFDNKTGSFRKAIVKITASEITMSDGDRYDLDGATLFTQSKGRTFEPAVPRFVFPMTPGAEKKGAYRITGEKNIPEWKCEYILRVIGLEQVTVPAGTFDAFKVEVSGRYYQKRTDGKSGKGTFRDIRWYSPLVKREVLQESETTNWEGNVSGRNRYELAAYSIK